MPSPDAIRLRHMREAAAAAMEMAAGYEGAELPRNLVLARGPPSLSCRPVRENGIDAEPSHSRVLRRGSRCGLGHCQRRFACPPACPRCGACRDRSLSGLPRPQGSSVLGTHVVSASERWEGANNRARARSRGGPKPDRATEVECNWIAFRPNSPAGVQVETKSSDDKSLVLRRDVCK